MRFYTLVAAVLAAFSVGCGTSRPGGGAGGVGGATGGGGGGNNGGPCAGALFCDDFESYALAQAPGGPWATKTTLGGVTVADTPTGYHSGTRAVKLTTQAKTSDGIKTAFMGLTGAPVFPLAANVLYGRMQFMLESAPQTSVHWTFIQGGGVVAGQGYHALYRYGGQLPVALGDGGFAGSRMMANYETPDSYAGTGPSSDCWQHASEQTVVPAGVWSCVEWKFDGPNNQMTLSLGGTPLPDLTVSGTGQGCVNQPGDFAWTAPAFDRIDIGWESYQTDDARTIWIDDVVISTNPIGCPTPLTP